MYKRQADFVWKYTYGRGAGTPTFLACRKGRDQVGGLCYDKCKSGYSVNENNKLRCKPPGGASYGRGAGRSPHPNMVVAAERSRLDYVILVAVKVIGEKGWFAGEQPKATIESLMKGNFCAQEEK